MEGTLWIKLGDAVVSINDFDVTFAPGQVRMDAKSYKIHGNFDIPESIKAPKKEKEQEKQTPVITQEQLNKEFKSKEDE